MCVKTEGETSLVLIEQEENIGKESVDSHPRNRS